jgi:hypothetical protein
MGNDTTFFIGSTLTYKFWEKRWQSLSVLPIAAK